MKRTKYFDWLKSYSSYGGILVFIIMAFEVMIMISPFAFFFYSVFNPVFAWFDKYTMTRWLTAFFLPHMILPPTLFLKSIRILGSILFVTGAVTFLVCAFQIYFNKIFSPRVTSKGLYTLVRHPQYLALGIWGSGMSILWPRFMVIASLSLMFVLYYFLARDEERRMLTQYGNDYAKYMEKTGRFLLRKIEGFLMFGHSGTNKIIKYAVVPLFIVTITLGTGFILRDITLHQLPWETRDNITLISILPEDNGCDTDVLASVKNLEKTKISFLDNKNDYLGYLMSADYVMQGMIADTGSDFHLFKQHHTIAMISDWVFHPFSHLRRSPSEHMAKMHNVSPVIARRHHCPMGIDEDMDCKDCPYRRVIFVQVSNDSGKHYTGKDLLSFNTFRVPVGFIDINVKTGEIVNMKEVGKASAWKNVPTPAF